MNSICISGLIAGFAVLGLLFLFAVFGFILDNFGVFDKTFPKSAELDENDVESGKATSSSVKTRTIGSKLSSSQNLSSEKIQSELKSNSTETEVCSVDQKSNETSGMKYWFSAQNPRAPSHRKSHSERRNRNRKLSSAVAESDTGSIFNFF